MKDTKLLLILEKQIDKIVLAVFALISVFLLWVYVVGNPYSEKVRIQGKEKTLSPSEIDRYVKQEAEKMFARGMDRQRNADDILEKKFKEALKRADESDDPPPRIFDLD